MSKYYHNNNGLTYNLECRMSIKAVCNENYLHFKVDKISFANYYIHFCHLVVFDMLKNKRLSDISRLNSNFQTCLQWLELFLI